MHFCPGKLYRKYSIKNNLLSLVTHPTHRLKHIFYDNFIEKIIYMNNIYMQKWAFPDKNLKPVEDINGNFQG